MAATIHARKPPGEPCLAARLGSEAGGRGRATGVDKRGAMVQKRAVGFVRRPVR